MEAFDVPRLTGLQAVLRPMKREDADAYYRIHKDPQNVLHYDWIPENREAALQGICDIIEDYQAGDYIHWALESREDGVLIGDLGIFIRDAKGEVNFMLDRHHTGRGIMSEALQAMMGWAFEKRSVIRIQALTMLDNHGANRMLARLGFTLEGTLRRYGRDTVRGGYCDLQMWSLLREEWEQKESAE